jgi:hypothetical protein
MVSRIKVEEPFVFPVPVPIAIVDTSTSSLAMDCYNIRKCQVMQVERYAWSKVEENAARRLLLGNWLNEVLYLH